VNKNLDRCQPYPFEKLADLLANSQPDDTKRPIKWSIGEPAHASPEFVKRILRDNLDGLSKYPVTIGSLELREAIADWVTTRFALPAGSIDPDKNVLPVSGTREALFSFAQSVVNGADEALVAMPNPFYQIYEGAAFMSDCDPYFLNLTEENGFLPDFAAVPQEVWMRCQLLYVCSPSNPTGACLTMEKWHELFTIASKHDFVIASDECYSEIYFDEQKPPVGLLEAAQEFGLTDYKGCVVFHSLSKRSNLPGLRSGFVAGDAKILDKYRLYRTYHGCALPPPTQAASAAAWRDEMHVKENRDLYRQKFEAVLNILKPVMDVQAPEAGFYLWPNVGMDDTVFTRRLFEEENLLVLPGSYISRLNEDVNPGAGRLRMALVAPFDECVEGAERLASFVRRLKKEKESVCPK